jgi:hypothetical protein
MAIINHTKKEINAKLVYFGPSGAGKEASLAAVYRKLKANCRGVLKSMPLQDSKMLFFDFVPPGQDSPSGFRVRFHIYTLVDTVASPSHWNLLLKGADGVVFVADSTEGSMADNRQSLQLLEECLGGFGTVVGTIPCVFQYNKRDIESPLPLVDLERTLNPKGLPAFPSSADRGEGVIDVLARLVRSVMKKLRDSDLETMGEEIQLNRAEPRPSLSSRQGLGAEESTPGPGMSDREPMVPAAEPSGAAAAIFAEVAIAGVPERVAGDRIRIPLSIGCGGQKKRLTVTLTVSIEES